MFCGGRSAADLARLLAFAGHRGGERIVDAERHVVLLRSSVQKEQSKREIICPGCKRDIVKVGQVKGSSVQAEWVCV